MTGYMIPALIALLAITPAPKGVTPVAVKRMTLNAVVELLEADNAFYAAASRYAGAHQHGRPGYGETVHYDGFAVIVMPWNSGHEHLVTLTHDSLSGATVNVYPEHVTVEHADPRARGAWLGLVLRFIRVLWREGYLGASA